MRKIIPSIFLIFIFYPSLSQTMKDLEKNHRIEFSVKKNNRSLENKTFTGLNLSFCDSDNDGFLAFDLIEILDQVQLSVASDLDDNDPRVLIGTSEGTFLEVGDILQNPTVTSLCDLVPASFDVAINSNSEIFTTNEDSIEQVNTGACTNHLHLVETCLLIHRITYTLTTYLKTNHLYIVGMRALQAHHMSGIILVKADQVEILSF